MRGGHSGFMSLKTMCPNPGGLGEEFYSSGSREGWLMYWITPTVSVSDVLSFTSVGVQDTRSAAIRIAESIIAVIFFMMISP